MKNMSFLYLSFSKKLDLIQSIKCIIMSSSNEIINIREQDRVSIILNEFNLRPTDYEQQNRVVWHS